MPKTYSSAGVDIRKGDALVDHIKAAARSTFNPSVLNGIGGFGALYKANFKNYRSPVLVSSVDGVGTKLVIAQMMDKHGSVGEDLVNHCVNDIAVSGAKPLYFMDYFASGKLKLGTAKSVIEGFVKACKENKCSLIGGETAEMPGFYRDNQYDLAGTIVGVVEKKEIIDGKRIRNGDVLIGIHSTGLHTNGFSLARSVLLPKFKLEEQVADLGTSIGDSLLAVHRSYLDIITQLRKRFMVHGFSHITGGGIIGNTTRIIPKGLTMSVDWTAWERPAIFSLIQKTGKVPEADMRVTFNLGIGLIAVVSKKDVDDAMQFLIRKKEQAVVLGEIVKQ